MPGRKIILQGLKSTAGFGNPGNNRVTTNEKKGE
jgi:hypothetical protein